jgi:hypothetical protein
MAICHSGAIRPTKLRPLGGYGRRCHEKDSNFEPDHQSIVNTFGNRRSLREVYNQEHAVFDVCPVFTLSRATSRNIPTSESAAILRMGARTPLQSEQRRWPIMRLDTYQPDGFHDELFTSSGAPRPEAKLLLETLESLEDGELLRCQQAAERLLLELGITFNV